MALILGSGEVSQNITKFAWRMRFTLAEQAGIIEASKTDSEVQAVKEAFESIPEMRGVNPQSAIATAMLNLFVSKGLLDPARIPVIQFTPISSEEAVQ